MKIKLFLTAIIILSAFQSNEEKLSNSICKLDWNSFKVNIISVRVLTSLNNDAMEIIHLKMSRERKSKILLDSVKNNNAIIIHMILTKIYEPDKFLLTYSLNYHKKANGKPDYDNSENDTLRYRINGVEWDEYYEHNVPKYKITTAQTLLMKKHWRAFLK